MQRFEWGKQSAFSQVIRRFQACETRVCPRQTIFVCVLRQFSQFFLSRFLFRRFLDADVRQGLAGSWRRLVPRVSRCRALVSLFHLAAARVQESGQEGVGKDGLGYRG